MTRHLPPFPTLRPLWRALMLACAGLAATGVSAKPPADPQVPGEVLLRLRSAASAGPLLARHPVTLVAQFGARPLYRLQVVGSATVAEVVRALELEPEVLLAEPNVLQQHPEARKNAVWAIGTAAQYAEQWAPRAMHLAEAHAISSGTGVRVAVLDTGVDASHPALAGRLLPGHDFVDGDTDPSEGGSPADAGHGHGTHVAGLVALAAPGARILPLRVLDAQGSGNTWAIAQALLHAVDPDGNPASNDGAQVINLSLGTLQRTRLLDTVLKLSTCSTPDRRTPAADFSDPGYSGDKERCRKFGGSVITAAAGNGGSGSERQYPAAEGEYGLIAVAASTEAGALAGFSNTGGWIHVAGPGELITSSVPGGGYGTWSGTSMAAPLVAATAALVRARFPTLKPAEVARRIEESGTTLCGTALLQADALAALAGLPGGPGQCR